MGWTTDESSFIPQQVQRFFHSPVALGPSQPPTDLVPTTDSPKVKRSEREADHLCTSSVKFKVNGAIPSLLTSLVV